MLRLVAQCCGLLLVTCATLGGAQIPDAKQFQDAIAKSPLMGIEKSRFTASAPRNFGDNTGFHQIFDGETLKGWDGDTSRWRVENGLIVGETPAKPAYNNTYLMYRAERPKDFDLKFEIKVDSGGSGVQYRSETGLPWLQMVKGAAEPNLAWMATGPQADFWPTSPASTSLFTGQVYLENDARGIVAWRGEVTESADGRSNRIVGTIADPVDLAGHFVTGAWNQYEIIARSGVLIHIINGRVMAVHIDDDPSSPYNRPGFLGLELEGQPARVEFRNLWLKTLDRQ